MKRTRQKEKLLLLQKILSEETDAEHPLSVPQLLRRLEGAGIPAERKSLYDDIEALQQAGMDIERQPGPKGGYYVAGRLFEVPELRLLTDAVQSSRFITEKKSMQLIRKLESLCSRNEAMQLQKQVFVSNRIKSMNESIYYNVDQLHAAIAQDRQISFQYFDWTPAGEKKLRHGGQRYVTSPWALLWDNENYYLIAYDEAQGGLRHYRVDKMMQITGLEAPREGKKQMERFDVASYAAQHFGMFGGAAEPVTLQFDSSLAGVVIDRFGADVTLRDNGDGTFRVHVTLAVTPVFLAWIISFGGRARILSPASAAEQLRQAARQVLVP
ncbi:MAG: WYL domain-containing protein [Clostridia bacterium]|nr:WYL domain-containing protein [Clostridia bacterium]